MPKLQLKALTKARKKQLAVIGIAGSALLIIILIMVQFIEGRKKEFRGKKITEEKVVTTEFTQPSGILSQQSLWQNTEGAKINTLEQQVAQLQQELNRKNNDVASPDGLGTPSTVGQSQINGLSNSAPLPPPPPFGAAPSANQAGFETRIKTLDLTVNPAGMPTTNIANSSDGARTISDTPGSSVRLASDFKSTDEWARVKRHRMNIEVIEDGGEVAHQQFTRGKFRARDSYIPTGTFFRSVLLGGVDAPTGGDAQNASPHPVLMRVTDFAQLPNRFKYNFKECFITGTAYGDISAERAYIRTQNLSCVGTDGRAIDMPMKGYVAGEDGKTGVRGTLVSKQGQILANALLVGVLSGVGQGVAESFKVTNDTMFGSSTTVRGSDQYKAGVASGISNAADRLAQYYIKLADKIFPVIEVNAGRTVDVVLLQGIEIDTGETR